MKNLSNVINVKLVSIPKLPWTDTKLTFTSPRPKIKRQTFVSKRKNDLDPQKSHLRIENSNTKKKDWSELKRKRVRTYDCQETIANDTTEVIVKKKITDNLDSSLEKTASNQKGHFECPICAKVSTYT